MHGTVQRSDAVVKGGREVREAIQEDNKSKIESGVECESVISSGSKSSFLSAAEERFSQSVVIIIIIIRIGKPVLDSWCLGAFVVEIWANR